jgi:hypothetical protein
MGQGCCAGRASKEDKDNKEEKEKNIDLLKKTEYEEKNEKAGKKGKPHGSLEYNIEANKKYIKKFSEEEIYIVNEVLKLKNKNMLTSLREAYCFCTKAKEIGQAEYEKTQNEQAKISKDKNHSLLVNSKIFDAEKQAVNKFAIFMEENEYKNASHSEEAKEYYIFL